MTTVPAQTSAPAWRMPVPTYTDEQVARFEVGRWWMLGLVGVLACYHTLVTITILCLGSVFAWVIAPLYAMWMFWTIRRTYQGSLLWRAALIGRTAWSLYVISGIASGKSGMLLWVLGAEAMLHALVFVMLLAPSPITYFLKVQRE